MAQRIASEDWDAAADAIAREGGALVRRAPETVEGWLAALPADRARRPELTLLAGQLAHGRGRLGEAVEHCRAAVAGFDSNGAPPYLRFAARFALADAYLAVGDLAAAAALGEALDDPAADGDLTARALGALAAIALAPQGRFDEGRALRDRAFADPVAAPIRGAVPVFDGVLRSTSPPGASTTRSSTSTRRSPPSSAWTRSGACPTCCCSSSRSTRSAGRTTPPWRSPPAGARWRAGRAWRGGSAPARRSGSPACRPAWATSPAPRRSWPTSGPAGARWGTWEFEATRAAIAAARGDGTEARAAAERAAAEPGRPRAVVRPDALRRHPRAGAGAGRPAGRAPARSSRRRWPRGPPGFSGARLATVLAWLLHEEGDETGSVAALAAAWEEAGDQARHVVRREWPRVERPLWAALEHEAVDPVAAVGAVADALPGRLGARAASPAIPWPRCAGPRCCPRWLPGIPRAIERLPEFERDADPGVAAAAAAAADRLRRDPPPLAFRLFGAFELRRGRVGGRTRRSGSDAWPRGWSACCSAAGASP